MRLRTPVLAAVIALAAAPGVNAKSANSGLFIAPQVSTLGLGIEAGYRFNNYIGVRGSANFSEIGRNFEANGIDYKGKLSLSSYGAMADVHPFGGAFRISAGFRINDNEVDLSATPSGSVSIGGRTYSAADAGSLRGRLDFQGFAPYVGIGWSTSLARNVYLGTDLGVLFQGSPRSSLSSSSGLVSAADFARERDELSKGLRGFRYYPVASISIGYCF